MPMKSFSTEVRLKTYPNASVHRLAVGRQPRFSHAHRRERHVAYQFSDRDQLVEKLVTAIG